MLSCVARGIPLTTLNRLLGGVKPCSTVQSTHFLPTVADWTFRNFDQIISPSAFKSSQDQGLDRFGIDRLMHRTEQRILFRHSFGFSVNNCVTSITDYLLLDNYNYFNCFFSTDLLFFDWLCSQFGVSFKSKELFLVIFMLISSCQCVPAHLFLLLSDLDKLLTLDSHLRTDNV